MGVEKSKNRLSEFIARACRLPKEVAGKVGNLSETLVKERLRDIQSHYKISYKFLIISIILLLYLPWMTSLTYIIPPQIDLSYGTDVGSESYCTLTASSEIGVTHAVLFNSTPFSFDNQWDMAWHPYWAGSYWDYDYNSYGWNASDGYHFTSLNHSYTVVVIERRMQIPIENYSSLIISAEFEGISGAASIYFEAFVGEARAVEEELILPENVSTVNVTAPLSIARATSQSWLAMVTFRLQIGFSVGGHIVLRSIVIDAGFTGKLSRVELDFKSTDNVSLFSNPCMKFADYCPRLAVVQNNDSETVSTYYPIRVDDEIYLPPGTYEGVAYWNLRDQEEPVPTNASVWLPNVIFTVSEDSALQVDIGLFAKRIDFEVTPSVLLRGFSMYFLDHYQYGGSIDIVGSTIYSLIPNYLYIPGEIESLSVHITTWSPMRPFSDYGWNQHHQFLIEHDISYNSSNRSSNLLFKINLPYIVIGGFVFGLGEFVVLSVILFLATGFLYSLRRALRYTNLRSRLSDSRIIPLLMLSAGIFLPWSSRLAQTTNVGYDSVSWISWFSMPFMVRWTSSTSVQLLLSVPDWWYATWTFVIFFFIPLCYGYMSLATVETEGVNKLFALVLLAPYLVALSSLNFASLNGETLSLGPILTLAALPVWLLRIGLRKLGVTT